MIAPLGLPCDLQSATHYARPRKLAKPEPRLTFPTSGNLSHQFFQALEKVSANVSKPWKTTVVCMYSNSRGGYFRVGRVLTNAATCGLAVVLNNKIIMPRRRQMMILFAMILSPSL
jgi:hypothetical protein